MRTEQERAVMPWLGRYGIDNTESTVSFATRHLFGLAPVRGVLALRGGTVDITEPLAESAVHAEIETASFRTGNAQRDGRVLSRRFLNPDRYPVMIFNGEHVDVERRMLTGTLTVRDVSRPVRLAIVDLTVASRSFAATATTRIDRTEFGVTAARGLAGRHLELTVEVRCVRT
ncbi:MAG TPA: YceI family protein [Streptosporangiaceae bacterium]|nr:YceI family protein [Streptosporangiaceae bacterium]